MARWSDELTSQEAAKLEALRATIRDREPREDALLLAEFGRHFGWLAVEAALDDIVDAATMMELLKAARFLARRERLERLADMHAAMSGVQGGKKGAAALNKHFKSIQRSDQ